ncbi:extended synaptotagmin-2 isoform X2 [Lutzomyia longipalpis]|uniref:extended synaptotagmin-2 isoform X2 n=1 Tax=Lutzomyia longipalpis TaxID=7200 RepID=UPI0024840305|nr:extended synaptotagmin-2 isoform X2 [Lutzomyia longipalpis]
MSGDLSEVEDLLKKEEPAESAVEATEAAAGDMPTVSKEKTPDEADSSVAKVSSDGGMFSLIYTVAKRVAVVGVIYFVGYMGWSVAWLIAPVIFSVARTQMRKKTELRRNIAKASAIATEREMILARIDELPAWVYFPDIERCEWVNRILKQVWPNANHFAKGLIKNTIEPNIQKALANYKLNSFKFDRMILGTIPPRIGGVKVYDKNISRNEIIMDLDLFYASDCDINFSLGGMRGGIKDFQIHGMVRVVMKPLINKMPLVGGLQIFFLNNPNIDFNLVGVVDLLDMPGLNDMLRRIIIEQVGAIMVLPNKLPITLSDEVPAVTLKMPEPEGVLRVHVMEAKDLMKKDFSVVGKGKSDPYAIVTVGAQQFRTQIIDNTVNPKWDFWCEAYIDVSHHTVFGVKLFDWDRTGEHDPLGRATVEITSVVKKGQLDTWLTLENAKHGMVHLRLAWMTLSTDRNDLSAALAETQMLRVTSMSTAILTIFIDSAKNLPQARPQSKPDPFLIVSVGKKQEQTAVQMRTDAPVWEQGFTFLVANPENDSVQLRIVDQKTEKELGQLSYQLSSLLTKGNLDISSEPFTLQKSGPVSKIVLSMSLRILKNAPSLEDEVESTKSTVDSSLSRTDSVTSAAQLSKQDSRMSMGQLTAGGETTASLQEEPCTVSSTATVSSATPPATPEYRDSTLIHRTSSTTSSAGFAGLGRIQLTLRYSVQRQRLIVIVHKIMNIPLKDPSNVPDPYVKLYLLPGRSKESKRKTNVAKDNCNPVYDATFEYIISTAELIGSELEVTVATQKGFLSGGSPVIGIVRVPLNDNEISQQGITTWYDLLPENYE